MATLQISHSQKGDDLMSIEANKILVHRLYEEVFNRGTLSTVDELLAADYVDHTAFPGTAPGPEGLKQFISLFRTAFPDLHMGISPTGKQVRSPALTRAVSPVGSWWSTGDPLTV
jgi:SnoaL-like polyketide cyclase